MPSAIKIHGLGEIAIRCHDLLAMMAFYRDIVGLKVLSPRDGIVFFRISAGHGGHTSVLALFEDQSRPVTAATSALHHLALTVDWADQAQLCDWLDGQGVPWRVETFEWIGWRGVFVKDPEGNTVEFVAADPAYPGRDQT